MENSHHDHHHDIFKISVIALFFASIGVVMGYVTTVYGLSDALVNAPATEENEPSDDEEDSYLQAKWIEVDNKYGFSFAYPQGLSVLQEGGEVEPLSIDESNNIILSDSHTSRDIYTQDLYDEFFYIGVLTDPGYGEDLTLEEVINDIWTSNKNNNNTFIETVQEPTRTEFKSKEAYTTIVVNEGLSTKQIGAWGNVEIYTYIAFEHEGEIIIIGYPEKELYRQILSTFELSDN